MFHHFAVLTVDTDCKKHIIKVILMAMQFVQNATNCLKQKRIKHFLTKIIWLFKNLSISLHRN